MMNKKEILRKVTNIDEKIFLSKILDKAEKAETTETVVYTDFLDPYQQKNLEKALNQEHGIGLSFYSGYSGAERSIAVFSPKNMGKDELAEKKAPLKLLLISVKSRHNLTHRDYLGALMSLGIKREKIGDILVKEDSCSIIVIEDIAEYLKYNLLKVGNTDVEVKIRDIEGLKVPEPKIKEIGTTVASLRLDSIASSGFGISRSKMVDFIKADKVSLNWEVTDNASKQVNEGDTISIRGKGRVVIKAVGGMTKKGRIGVTLERLI